MPRTSLDELLLPFLGPPLLRLPASPIDVHQLRRQITGCTQLRDATRRRWLAELVPRRGTPRFGLLEIPVDVVRHMQQKVALEARYTAQEASLIDSSLVLLRPYVQACTG
jgi:hypothetical protein